MDPISIIFSIIILVMSIVIHELSHGYTAELLGDPTPRLQGRLTLNPLKHLDMFGSVIVPIVTSLNGFTFGWAKPVEWNPYNVKNKRWGEFLISIAGPVSNIIIALVFGTIIRVALANGSTIVSSSFIQFSAYIVMVNIVLAVFNLIPVPPLDGSKVMFALLPQTPAFMRFREGFERHALILMFVVAFVLWRVVEPVVPILFRLIVA